ncbi:MAG TPA: hypothetical protein VJT49_18665 [Amycolatopsis sp.]|uniref:hypothetical protein n=1 Tax=Amycolatopsis sp. TaxID=37632 RepID=UPI002B4958CA|nr:hypothetical protein [Amycolatopsis sp.]HKS47089.1 hypothetical protein [Amycolatopsis sp.]
MNVPANFPTIATASAVRFHSQARGSEEDGRQKCRHGGAQQRQLLPVQRGTSADDASGGRSSGARRESLSCCLSRLICLTEPRCALRTSPGTETDTFSASRLFAATYPEAVSIAELIGSLPWRRLAAGGPHDQRRFTTEIGRRLSLRDYYPTVVKDPISHWMEQDCWHPPSPPNTDYRSLKTFGGTAFRRPARDSEEKRCIAAYWFSIHHRGGDVMLHHRTLNPVVIRDRSVKMEMFTSALALTAATNTKMPPNLTAKQPTQFMSSEWIRPQPQPSSFLDTAQEPIPWVKRAEPRPPTGARPQLPSERRALGALPINPLRQNLRSDGEGGGARR